MWVPIVSWNLVMVFVLHEADADSDELHLGAEVQNSEHEVKSVRSKYLGSLAISLGK